MATPTYTFLTVFDAVGLVLDRQTRQLVPRAADWLRAQRRQGARMAIIANEGGPACRDAGWGWSQQYPALAQVEEIYTDLYDNLRIPYYLSLAYVSSQGSIYLPRDLKPGDSRANALWRLPSPGMILQAMQDFEIENPRQVRVVSVWKEAERAAQTLGCTFINGHNYFEALLKKRQAELARPAA